MAFSYDKLWKVLEKKEITKENLKKKTGLSSTTIAKLAKNKPISMTSLEKICKALKCDISEILELESVD